MIEYIIHDIKIYSKLQKYETNVFVVLKIDNDTLAGNVKVKCIPEKKDIIKCNIHIENNKKYFRNEQFLLPMNERDQKCRILKIYNGDNKILKELEFIKFGKNFWKDYILYIYKIKDNENYTIRLKILYDYIIHKNYIYILLKPFKEILSNYNITRLTNKQLLILYEFNKNISNWNIDIDQLVSLYDKEGFGYTTIIQIAKGLKKSIEDITILIIINIFYTNKNTYIIYDYSYWLDELSKYSEININDFTNDNFLNIIDNMIKKKIIIQIEESKLCLYKIYNDELFIAQQLISIQYNDKTLPLIQAK